MKLVFPLDLALLEALKAEYKKEAERKGNTWLDMKLGDLFILLQEEQDEVQELINNGDVHDTKILEELKDSILVSCMVYRVLLADHKGLYKE
jgi:hypothetical protein